MPIGWQKAIPTNNVPLLLLFGDRSENEIPKVGPLKDVKGLNHLSLLKRETTLSPLITFLATIVLACLVVVDDR